MARRTFLVTVFEGAWSPDREEKPASQEVAFALGDAMVAPWLEKAVKGLRKGEHAQLKEGDVVKRTVRIDNVVADTGGPAPKKEAKEAGASDGATGEGEMADEPNGGGPPDAPSAPTESERAEKELERLRAAGNAELTAPNATYRQWRKAILHYNRALGWAASVAEPENAEMKLRLNIALASFKLEKWSVVTLQCDRVLSLDPASTKAYFRRGVARFNLGLGEAAITDLREAHKLCPDDGKIKAELERVIAKQYAGVQKGRQEFAQMYSKMVSGSIFMKRRAAA